MSCEIIEPVARLLTISEKCPKAIANRDNWSINSFILIKRIAIGAISSVFYAVCHKSATPCVIKVYLKSNMSTLNRRQIEREINIHSSLNHPHIVDFYAAFEDDERIYLVQEFANGGDLFEYVRIKNGRLSEKVVVSSILWPLLSALSYLHSRNILHRDIKPENIVFDKNHALKLTDFGLAIDSNTDRPVTRLGTLDYMAPQVLVCPDKTFPEEHKDRPDLEYGVHVDIWAIGVLTYELIVGWPPFSVGTREGTIKSILIGTPIIAESVSPAAASFILACLQRDPTQRAAVSALLVHPWILSFPYDGSFLEDLPMFSLASPASNAVSALATVINSPSPSPSLLSAGMASERAVNVSATDRVGYNGASSPRKQIPPSTPQSTAVTAMVPNVAIRNVSPYTLVPPVSYPSLPCGGAAHLPMSPNHLPMSPNHLPMSHNYLPTNFFGPTPDNKASYSNHVGSNNVNAFSTSGSFLCNTPSSSMNINVNGIRNSNVRNNQNVNDAALLRAGINSPITSPTSDFPSYHIRPTSANLPFRISSPLSQSHNSKSSSLHTQFSHQGTATPLGQLAPAVTDNYFASSALPAQASVASLSREQQEQELLQKIRLLQAASANAPQHHQLDSPTAYCHHHPFSPCPPSFTRHPSVNYAVHASHAIIPGVSHIASEFLPTGMNGCVLIAEPDFGNCIRSDANCKSEDGIRSRDENLNNPSVKDGKQSAMDKQQQSQNLNKEDPLDANALITTRASTAENSNANASAGASIHESSLQSAAEMNTGDMAESMDYLTTRTAKMTIISNSTQADSSLNISLPRADSAPFTKATFSLPKAASPPKAVREGRGTREEDRCDANDASQRKYYVMPAQPPEAGDEVLEKNSERIPQQQTSSCPTPNEDLSLTAFKGEEGVKELAAVARKGVVTQTDVGVDREKGECAAGNAINPREPSSLSANVVNQIHYGGSESAGHGMQNTLAWSLEYDLLNSETGEPLINPLSSDLSSKANNNAVIKSTNPISTATEAYSNCQAYNKTNYQAPEHNGIYEITPAVNNVGRLHVGNGMNEHNPHQWPSQLDNCGHYSAYIKSRRVNNESGNNKCQCSAEAIDGGALGSEGGYENEGEEGKAKTNDQGNSEKNDEEEGEEEGEEESYEEEGESEEEEGEEEEEESEEEEEEGNTEIWDVLPILTYQNNTAQPLNHNPSYNRQQQQQELRNNFANNDNGNNLGNHIIDMTGSNLDPHQTSGNNNANDNRQDNHLPNQCNPNIHEPWSDDAHNNANHPENLYDTYSQNFSDMSSQLTPSECVPYESSIYSWNDSLISSEIANSHSGYSMPSHSAHSMTLLNPQMMEMTAAAAVAGRGGEGHMGTGVMEGRIGGAETLMKVAGANDNYQAAAPPPNWAMNNQHSFPYNNYSPSSVESLPYSSASYYHPPYKSKNFYPQNVLTLQANDLAVNGGKGHLTRPNEVPHLHNSYYNSVPHVYDNGSNNYVPISNHNVSNGIHSYGDHIASQTPRYPGMFNGQLPAVSLRQPTYLSSSIQAPLPNHYCPLLGDNYSYDMARRNNIHSPGNSSSITYTTVNNSDNNNNGKGYSSEQLCNDNVITQGLGKGVTFNVNVCMGGLLPPSHYQTISANHDNSHNVAFAPLMTLALTSTGTPTTYPSSQVY